MEPIWTKTDVVPTEKKYDLNVVLISYINAVEAHFALEKYKITLIRSDKESENYSLELVSILDNWGIEIYFSLSYAPESNGFSKRLVQENWTKPRVLLQVT